MQRMYDYNKEHLQSCVSARAYSHVWIKIAWARFWKTG